MARRYSNHEIEAAVLISQDRRRQERENDPAWRWVEAGDGLPGLVWRYDAAAPLPVRRRETVGIEE